jgi:hypothetical protein
MRVILELFRIVIIYLLLGGIMGGLAKLMYAKLGIEIDNTYGALLVGLAIFLFIFVLYRNKIQFIGFYKGPGKVKLSNPTSIFLICCSFLMLILVPFFNTTL